MLRTADSRLSLRRSGVVLLLVAAGIVIGCATQANNAATPRVADPLATSLASLRKATEKFQVLDSAVAAGFPREVAQCLVHEHHGAMGYHHVNRANFSRDIDVTKPQILLYERMPDSTYRLNGVEFIMPFNLWPMDSVAPQIMGRPMYQEHNLKFWYTHVWIWRDNPGGVFSNFHPDVQCPASTRRVYTPNPPTPY